MRRAVQRGLERRQLDRLKYLGMDEKSFRRGQSYVTLLTDLEESRVLDVVEERTAEAAGQLWDTLSPEQKQGRRGGRRGHVGTVYPDDPNASSRRGHRA